jgi:hypothetical protein
MRRRLPSLARNRHAAAVAECPELRDERTCRQRCLRTFPHRDEVKRQRLLKEEESRGQMR